MKKERWMWTDGSECCQMQPKEERETCMMAQHTRKRERERGSEKKMILPSRRNNNS